MFSRYARYICAKERRDGVETGNQKQKIKVITEVGVACKKRRYELARFEWRRKKQDLRQVVDDRPNKEWYGDSAEALFKESTRVFIGTFIDKQCATDHDKDGHAPVNKAVQEIRCHPGGTLHRLELYGRDTMDQYDGGNSDYPKKIEIVLPYCFCSLLFFEHVPILHYTSVEG